MLRVCATKQLLPNPTMGLRLLTEGETYMAALPPRAIYRQEEFVNFFFWDFIFNIIYLFIWLYQVLAAAGKLSCSMWDLVFWPGIEPGTPAMGTWSLNHWATRKVMSLHIYSKGFEMWLKGYLIILLLSVQFKGQWPLFSTRIFFFLKIFSLLSWGAIV